MCPLLINFLYRQKDATYIFDLLLAGSSISQSDELAS